MSDIPQYPTAKKRARKWRPAFLAALAEAGNVRLACDAAQIDRTTAYDLRKADQEFAAEWDRALEDAADLLEQEARRRAVDGVRRVKFDRGQPIMVPALGPDGAPMLGPDGAVIMVPYAEHEYSDTLLIFLMKGGNPEKWRDRSEVRHTTEPIDWDRVPADVRDAFIAGKLTLDDVQRSQRGN